MFSQWLMTTIVFILIEIKINMLLSLYMDDILIAGKDLEFI